MEEKALRSLARRCARESQNELQEYGKWKSKNGSSEKNHRGFNPAQEELYDFAPKQIRRRVNAVVKYANRIKGFPGLKNPEEVFAKLCTDVTSPYDAENAEYSGMTAAALWILDSARSAESIFAIQSILPDAWEEEGEMTSDPYISDILHDSDMVAGLAFVLENRNGRKRRMWDKVLVDGAEPHEPRPSVLTKIQSGEATCSTKPTQGEAEITQRTSRVDEILKIVGANPPETDRDVYDTVLSLIPQEDITHACEAFERKLWEMTDILMKCFAIIEKEIGRAEEKLEAKKDQIRTLGVNMSSPLFNKRDLRKNEVMALLEDGADIEERIMQLEQVKGWLYMMAQCCVPLTEDAVCSYLVDGDPGDGTFWNEQQEKLEKGKSGGGKNRKRNSLKAAPWVREIASLLSSFRIDDPYEICFAVLYLLDTGNSLPWVYIPGTAVFASAVSVLPWSHGEYFDEQDVEDLMDGADYPASGNYNRNGLWDRKRSEVAHPALRPVYEPHYTGVAFSAYDPGERLNTAQLVYKLTGMVLPRNLHPFEREREKLKEAGMEPVEADRIIELSEVCFFDQFRAPKEYGYGLFEKIRDALDGLREDEDEEGKTEDEPGEGGQNGDLKKQAEEITILKTLLRQTETALRAAQREKETQQRELEAAAEKTAAEMRELAQLRELVFNASQESEPEIRSNVALPYTVEKRTVVFGGHESWRKAIRPMLEGEIRFIDADHIPDVNLIRNAQAVWLQSNKISHAYYYRLINVVRACGAEMNYFTYASAEKCARQLAERDKA